jgi:FeS assembly SUF system protein
MIDLLQLARRPAPPSTLERDVIDALRTLHDPEIPVNIYDLGLIYDLEISATCEVHIRMTLTAPGCPVAQSFPGLVADKVRAVPGVASVEVELVWEPPWDASRMSEMARLDLGLF